MSNILIALLQTLLTVLGRKHRQPPSAPTATAPVDYGSVAPPVSAAVPAAGGVPEGFVPHAWTDRADPQDGRL